MSQATDDQLLAAIRAYRTARQAEIRAFDAKLSAERASVNARDAYEAALDASKAARREMDRLAEMTDQTARVIA